MYNIYNQKVDANEKSAELQNKINNLNGTIDNLQGKIDTISNTINTDNNSNKIDENDNTTPESSSTNNLSQDTNTDNINNTTNTKSENVISFTDEQIKDSFQKYLDLVSYSEASPSTVLLELKIINSESNKSAKKEGYLKTNVKYSEFKETMSNYITKKCYQKEFGSAFIEENGYLCYFNGGESGMKYEVKTITKEDDKTYKATAEWSQESEKENVSFEFGIENNKGKCVIDYCNQK